MKLAKNSGTAKEIACHDISHVRHRSRAEQYAAGKALREVCPRNAHTAWKPPSNRLNAVDIVLQSEKGRMPDLLPLR